MADTMIDEGMGEGPQKRKSSLSLLEISNLRRLWSMRKSSISPSPSDFMPGEVLPNLKNYQHRMSISGEAGLGNRRLTLNELLNDEKGASFEEEINKNQASNDAKGKVYKMNWVEGVFMTCLLNIWGVMLFLRLTWVIGEAGLLEGLGILTVSNTVTFITSLSMSAVSTNGQITAGGIYYMISRSLGPEFGGAIGLMFVLAQSMAIAMHLIGFCESLLDMLIQYIDGFESILNAGRINDIRLLGMIALICILGLAIVGMSWMTRVQYLLLAILVLAQLDFIIGTFIPPSEEKKAKGFVGYSIENYNENFWSAYTMDERTGNLHSFFSVFAVYFPSCTGIVAGANLSGDLKDPAGAIPKGTLLAVGTTYFSYILYGILSAGCSIRYASGIVAEYQFSQGTLNESMAEELNITQGFNNCTDRECSFGLIPSQQMIELMSAWGPLIYAGCFAATLSSAIACMFGAPRVFQAVAKDKLYPGLHFFAQGHGINNDPFRGYGMVFIIAGTCILIGSLNQVSSVLSNFYVAAYALINFSVFHASITKSPGWRPTFKYHNRWLSLFGTLLCLGVMILMDYRTALATYICILLLYIIIKSNKPDANWGSSNQSMSFVNALKSVQALAKVEDHVKTFRPKIILLSGEPSDRPGLIDFANLITKNLSLLQCINVVEEDISWETIAANKARMTKWLYENHIKAFYSLIRQPSFHKGASISMEVAGLGKLSPNMLLVGFQEKWSSHPEDAREYVKTLQSAFDLHLSVGIFRLQGGFDISSLGGLAEAKNGNQSRSTTPAAKYGSSTSVDSGIAKSVLSLEKPDDHSCMKEPKFLDKILPSSKTVKVLYSPTGAVIEDPELIERMTQFRGKDPINGETIDVYWLYDDGGLTLLLPFILKMRSKFAKCQLRVFCLVQDIENMEEEAKSMTILLKKFRIAFSDVILLSDARTLPSKATSSQFESLLTQMLNVDISTPTHHEPPPNPVSGSDLIKHREMTNFHLRMAEIVRENSRNSSLIVMTLPLPKKVGLPPLLYMAWLDFISRQLPPFLFVRGNQVSVLTFYS